MDSDHVCSSDLDLDPMTFIYKLDPFSKRYTEFAKMNFLRQGFQKLSSDRVPTDIGPTVRTYTYILRHRNYIPRNFTGGQK